MSGRVVVEEQVLRVRRLDLNNGRIEIHAQGILTAPLENGEHVCVVLDGDGAEVAVGRTRIDLNIPGRAGDACAMVVHLNITECNGWRRS